MNRRGFLGVVIDRFQEVAGKFGGGAGPVRARAVYANSMTACWTTSD